MKHVQKISFIGAGALASGLAVLLHQDGYAIGEIVSRRSARSLRRASQLAHEVGAEVRTLVEARLDCDLLWLAVPDEAIAPVAAELAGHTHLPPIVLHASGALSSHALHPLTARGVHTGSAHPLMTFVAGAPPNLHDAWFALEGAPAAVRAARRIAGRLGAHSFTIRAENKTLYHAFGAMLSPMLAAELEAASRLGLRAGISVQKLRQLMRPIVERTVQNVLSKSAAKSFSGPLARGDVRTVAAHLQALDVLPEGGVYRALAGYAIQTLPVARREEMKKLMESSKLPRNIPRKPATGKSRKLKGSTT